jgi:ACS family hexuronate transporter-like MFS transporter
MGEAGNWPAGVKLVAEWFPPEERALASGIFNSGSSIGAVIAPPLVTWIVLSSGWREAFAFVGLTGFIWLIFWLMLYRPRAGGLLERPPRPMALRALLRDRFLWQLTLSKVFSDPVWYFYIFWFSQYLRTARGFTLLQIGQTAWIPFLAADIGNLMGGMFSGRLTRRGIPPDRAHRMGVLVFSLLMTAAIPAVLVRSAPVSIGLVALAALGYTGSLANLLSVPADAYSKDNVGSIWGFASMGAGFGGMVFSLITGSVVERWSFTPVFIMFGVTPLIAATLVWRLPKRTPPED